MSCLLHTSAKALIPQATSGTWISESMGIRPMEARAWARRGFSLGSRNFGPSGKRVCTLASWEGALLEESDAYFDLRFDPCPAALVSMVHTDTRNRLRKFAEIFPHSIPNYKEWGAVNCGFVLFYHRQQTSLSIHHQFFREFVQDCYAHEPIPHAKVGTPRIPEQVAEMFKHSSFSLLSERMQIVQRLISPSSVRH